MRIVSLNAWGGALYDDLIGWLADAGADVLCLQEVTRTPGLEGWARFEDPERSLPQRANLYRDIDRALPEHVGHFAVCDSGPVEASGATHRQDFGIAFFIHRDLSVAAEDTEFVHGSLTSHRAWPPSGRPRRAQAVRLHHPNTARATTIVHVHGLRDSRGKQDTPARREQAYRLAGLVERTRGPDDLVVVGGDMNLLPSSETFTVLGDLGLVDLVGTSDTRTSHYVKPTRHASYLLVSDPGAVKHFEVLMTPEVSDHRALVLDV